MIRLVLAGLISLFPALAAAQQALPALHDVTGVAADDMLNIRELPGAGARIIGALGPEQTGIEVVSRSEDGDWGQVNTGERAGWVALRYLARQPDQPDNELPRPLQCFGTEPFWSVTLSRQPLAEFTRPSGDPISFASLYSIGSSNRTDRYAVFGTGETGTITAVLRRETCSDGMSDRAFGLSVDLIIAEENGPGFLSGCCRLSD